VARAALSSSPSPSPSFSLVDAEREPHRVLTATCTPARIRDVVFVVPAARQLAPPPPPSWQLEDHRLLLGSRTINPAARRTITREYVYYVTTFACCFVFLLPRAPKRGLASCFFFFPRCVRRACIRCIRTCPSSPLPCFRLGCRCFPRCHPFIGDLLPVASRIPRTFSLKPTVYNDRLLIVQGQRQYINGPRIKWQQRGVVEHNPSWSNTAGMRRAWGKRGSVYICEHTIIDCWSCLIFKYSVSNLWIVFKRIRYL